MRLLLDTHVFLWWRSKNGGALGPTAKAAVADADQVFVSAASAWECTIKASLGKLTLPEPFADGVDDSGFDRLAITMEHAALIGTLPPRHKDPFDRILVAQAVHEGLTLVTADHAVAAYDTLTLWALA